MKLKQGLIEVYTGNGKGKTTAAFGLALRAVGWGLRVHITQFMKLGTYGENYSSEKLGQNLSVECVGKPYFIAWEDEISAEDRRRIKNVKICKKGNPPSEYKEMVQKSFLKTYDETVSGKWDIVIMDEANVAVYYNLLEANDLLRLIDNKPEKVELVFTGRKIPDEILARADLITEMNEVKHPYSSGVAARKGIDF